MKVFNVSAYFAVVLVVMGGLRVSSQVPEALLVQGRFLQPLTQITGTATILPAGVSQLFSAQTDKEGVFQFALTDISSQAFSSKESFLRLQVGASAIDIPFRSVPFAFRSAVAESVSAEAPAQFITVNVTSVTATNIQVTSISVTNILASSATVSELKVPMGLSVGQGTILLGATAAGADNTIRFTGPPNGFGGLIETAAPGPGPLTLQTAGANPINLNPGGPGTVSIGGAIELLSGQRIIHSVAGALRVESDGLNNLRLNSANAGHVLAVEGGGNLGVGVPALTPPVNKLDVEGSVAIGASYAGANIAPLNGLLVEGSVGIGTPSPTHTLHVLGNALVSSSASISGAGLLAAEPAFQVIGGTFTVLVDGNIGIGTISPTQRLDVSGTIRGTDITCTDCLGAADIGDGLGVTEIDETAIQRRVAGICPLGSSILQINQDGTVVCDGALTSEVDGIIGNEVTDTANTTLIRTGAGTAADPFRLSLNLGSANTWTTPQSFNADTNFPQSGIWTTSGNLGIGIISPTHQLDVNGGAIVRSSLTVVDALVVGFGPSPSILTPLGNLNLSGLISNDDIDSSSVTKQGNIFNSPNRLVQLNSLGALPALDASNLLNLNASGITSGILDNARIDSSSVTKLGPSVEWNEITQIPADLADGDQVGIGLEADTLQSVTNRGSSTTQIISVDGLSAGVNPASSGIIRIPNALAIRARNSSNTGDITLIGAGFNNAVAVGNVPNMFLLDSGNVGIGTTSPGSPLEVFQAGSNQAKLRLTSQDVNVGDGWTSVLEFFASPRNSLTPVRSGRILSANTGNSFSDTVLSLLNASDAGFIETMTLKNGNVGIGTTSPQGSLQVNSGDSSFVVKSTGSVGIGTTSPGARLQVGPFIETISGEKDGIRMTVQPASAGNGALGEKIRWGFSNGAFIASVQEHVSDIAPMGLVFYTHQSTDGGIPSTERMRINKDGNVGIGTTNPGSTLDVIGSASFGSGATKSTFTSTGDLTVAGNLAVSGSSGIDLGLGVNDDLTATDVTDLTDGGETTLHQHSGSSLAGVIRVQETLQSGAIFYVSSASVDGQTLLARTSGNVGIGTASPGRKLEVVGSFMYRVPSDPTNNFLEIFDNGANATIVRARHVGTDRIQLHTSGPSFFMGGNVGIGTTNPGSSSAWTRQLHISGNFPGIALTSTQGSGRNYSIGSNNNGAFQINDDTAGLPRLYIDPNGNVGIGIGTTTPAHRFQVNSGASSFVITSTGSVGIGTTSPGSPLEVFQAGSNQAKLRLTSQDVNVGDGWTSVLEFFASPRNSLTPVRSGRILSANTGNSFSDTVLSLLNASDAGFIETMTLKNGNVGIGTTWPFAGLDVQNSISASVGPWGTARGVNIAPTLTAVANGNFLIGLRIAPTFSEGTYTGVKKFGLIVEDGSVGIGTTNPLQKLHVTGSGYFSGSVGIGTTSPLQKLHVDGASYFNGNVGIGTASIDIGAKLHVAGNIKLMNHRGIFSNAQTLIMANVYNDGLWKGATTGPASIVRIGPDAPFIVYHDAMVTADRNYEPRQIFSIGTDGFVHIKPVGTADAQLEVSDGSTTGGGIIHRADSRVHSSRNIKSNIRYLTELERLQAYNDVLALKPAEFRYKVLKNIETLEVDSSTGSVRNSYVLVEDINQPLRRGLISEDSPASIKNSDAISIGDRILNLEMAFQELAMRFEVLKTEFENYKKNHP